MIVDGAARAALQNINGMPRLGRALVTAVTEGVVAEPRVLKAVLRAQARPGLRQTAVVKTEHGDVRVRAPHASVVMLELPCDAEAGLLFRARTARGGDAFFTAADVVDSGNLSVFTVRGALGAFAEQWPRELMRVDATACGLAAAALPFLHSVRCEGLGDSMAGPTVSLRLLSEQDDRALAWTTQALGEAPARCGGVEFGAAMRSVFVDLFTDPVFQTRFREAAQTAMTMQARGERGSVHFVFRDVKFDVAGRPDHLVLACPQHFRPPGAEWWMVQRQLEDPRVALSARLTLAASQMFDAMKKEAALAARVAGLGEIDKVETWWSAPDRMELHFKRGQPG